MLLAFADRGGVTTILLFEQIDARLSNDFQPQLQNGSALATFAFPYSCKGHDKIRSNLVYAEYFIFTFLFYYIFNGRLKTR